jgi:acetoin utilization protein AcuB
MLIVKELMTAEPDTVGPSASLREVLAKMNRDGCRHLPVVDGDQLLGIITDRDVRLAVNSPVVETDQASFREEVLDSLDAQSCMTREPTSVTPQTPAHEAADLLSLYKFGGLPVLDKGSLVGIVTTTDFLRFVADQEKN